MRPNIPPGYIILTLFFITQVIGLATGLLLITHSKDIEEFRELEVAPVAEKGSVLNSLFFIGYILIMAVLLYLGIKLYKGVLLFRILEIFIITFASSIVLFVFMTVYGIEPDVAVGVGVMAGFLLAMGKAKIRMFRNAGAVLSSAGVGSVFGYSLGLIPSIVFAILLSIYDYIAVFKTKHMVRFAERFTSYDLAFTIAAGPKPSAEKMKKLKKLPFEERVRRMERTELGTGDLVVPVMLSVSVYPFLGLVGSLSVVLCSTIALYLIMRLMMKKKQILPALPPLVTGAFIGMLIAALLSLVNTV